MSSTSKPVLFTFGLNLCKIFPSVAVSFTSKPLVEKRISGVELYFWEKVAWPFVTIVKRLYSYSPPQMTLICKVSFR
jgi:hypothetical protein